MKTILITGVGRGIGKALAEKFLAEGYAVIGASQAGSVGYSHPNLSVVDIDLAAEASISACAESLARSGKKIDTHINCAGVLLDNDDFHLDIDKLRKTLEVNLFGTASLTEKVIPLLSSDAHIVNISSQAGSLQDIEVFEHSHAPFRYPAYKISKAALNMYTRTLALRLRHEGTGIIVSCIHPGWVSTDMGGSEAPRTPAEAAQRIYELAISRPETGQFWFDGKKYPW